MMTSRGTSGLHPGRCGRIFFFFWRGEQKLEEFSHKATAVPHRFFCLFDRDVD